MAEDTLLSEFYFMIDCLIPNVSQLQSRNTLSK